MNSNTKSKPKSLNGLTETDMTFGKIKVSALAIALGIGIMSLSQYLIIEAAIILCIICALFMIPFVGTMKIYFQRAQRKLKNEHIPILQKHVGFLTFFSNRDVIWHDCVMVAVIVLSVAAIAVKLLPVYLWAAFRLFGTYTFFVHCFYNGRVYNSLKAHEMET